MKVSKLIELLKDMPQDAKVFIDYGVDLVDPVVELIITDYREPYIILNK